MWPEREQNESHQVDDKPAGQIACAESSILRRKIDLKIDLKIELK
jgi:hypothetical protein